MYQSLPYPSLISRFYSIYHYTLPIHVISPPDDLLLQYPSESYTGQGVAELHNQVIWDSKGNLVLANPDNLIMTRELEFKTRHRPSKSVNR
ncbi:hypothetical protein HDV02_002503 [Globomyces sp. JEL0801]|nr:hypothetical protein HDV02_002503 [Globomyces sp. JEL0801]